MNLQFPISILRLFVTSLLLSTLLSSCKDKVDKSLTTFPEWGEVLTPAIDGIELGASNYEGYKEICLNLTQGQQLEFAGVKDTGQAIDQTWFEYVSDQTIKFTGPAGKYYVLYINALGLITVEQRGEDVAYPDALWLMGEQWAYAQVPYTAVSGWTWSVEKTLFAKKTGNTSFEIVVYLHNGFKIKFFKVWENWSGDQHSQAYDFTSTPMGLFEPHATNGDLQPGTAFTPGVYRVVIDMEAKTFTGAAIQQ